MKAKKTTKADLNNKRGLFFQIGLTASLLMAIGFFMWSQPVISEQPVDISIWTETPDYQPIPLPEPEPVKQEQHIEVQTIIERFNIHENDRKINTNISWTEGVEDFVFQPMINDGPETVIDDSEIIDSFAVSDQPLFMGKDVSAFRAWVMQHVKYPTVAAENGVQGRVTVQFVIDRNGTLTGIEVLAAPDRSLADEAVRILKSAPAEWTAGKQRGRPVAVRFTIPVEFKLQ